MIPVSREVSLEGHSSCKAPHGPVHRPGVHHTRANDVEGSSTWSLWETLWVRRKLREWKNIKRKPVIQFSAGENQLRLEYDKELSLDS